MKKIIVLYSTGGMGHKKCAVALFDAFKRRNSGVEVKNIDALDFASKFYKFVYMDIYGFFMTQGKRIWSILYFLTNIDLIDRLMCRNRIDVKNFGKLEEMLVAEAPDAVLTTHFALPSIAKHLRESKHFKAKLYVTVTDYGPHSYWLSNYIDRFFVGSQSMVSDFIKRGIKPEKITVTGIPSMEEFTWDFDVPALKEKYGLDKNKKTVFLMSGGFGVGPIEKILLALNACKADFQVITVCGHNKKAYENISVLKAQLKYPMVLFGFTDKVAELMAVSDLMITKAGGISVTEALNMRLPMILIASIPGQETWNENLLMGSGAAKKAKKAKEIPSIVDNIFSSEELYGSMKAGIDRLRKPRAAADIVEMVMKDLGV